MQFIRIYIVMVKLRCELQKHVFSLPILDEELL